MHYPFSVTRVRREPVGIRRLSVGCAPWHAGREPCGHDWAYAAPLPPPAVVRRAPQAARQQAYDAPGAPL